MSYYILDDQHNVVAVDSIQAFTKWQDSLPASVCTGAGCWLFRSENKEYRVSTVFMFCDHNLSGEGPPIVFESMVFDLREDGQDVDCLRASTYQEAKENHDRLCKDYL